MSGNTKKSYQSVNKPKPSIMWCAVGKRNQGCTEGISLQVFVPLTQSTRFSYKSCILSPGVYGFPGSAIMSLLLQNV